MYVERGASKPTRRRHTAPSLSINKPPGQVIMPEGVAIIPSPAIVVSPSPRPRHILAASWSANQVLMPSSERARGLLGRVLAHDRMAIAKMRLSESGHPGES